ncbi:MAG: hypothetical protein PHU61_03325 [Candidatus Absconditabacteria bacterium]|nr:hypothetical protein [Candidatus Absconditabacteria bacterium]MDD3868296.1 hypothetical protein [Candidatus Absconditabacteria bacterium]MDD4714015.1 hypothetical protein [Candidatus Absconditabacteria bacterium]
MKITENSSFKEIEEKVSGFFSAFKKKSGSTTVVMTRQQALTSGIIAVVSLVALIVYGIFVYQNYQEINSKSSQLHNTSAYNPNIGQLEYNGVRVETIQQILEINSDLREELNKFQKISTEQKQYYEILLRNIYLPSINLWKNPYTNFIDVSIMGERYLNEDPFQDIPLIQTRSDFFRSVGEGNDYNEITNISIGDIEDINEEHFIIPIDVSFTAPSKQGFLLLVNKLSTTSNANNISLLNEFFYYLFKNIKEDKQEEIQQLKEQYKADFSENNTEIEDDIIIGYTLYNRIKKNEENSLIDDNLLNETIRENVPCNEKTSDNECFYSFREKFRDIPQLAYTIGVQNSSSRLTEFHNFLKELPPIISIKDFSFEKQNNYGLLVNTTEQYVGKATINVYGRSMKNEEVEEVAIKLGNLCFGTESEQAISPEYALNTIEENIAHLADNQEISSIITEYEELQKHFSKIQEEYPELTNYKKTIRLFEIFRMLKEGNLCK